MQPQIQKKCFIFEIIVSELVSLNCLYLGQDTCHRKEMCEQGLPRIDVSIRETFSNSISLTLINKYDKGAMMQISKVLGHVYHAACRIIL